MRIHCPCQPAGEQRVALTPDVVATLTARDHIVTLEPGAGIGAGFDDEAYRDAGAEVTADATSADLIATVAAVGCDGARSVLGLLEPFRQSDRMSELAASGTIVFAFEAVPRTTRAQVVDALSSQATTAGYQAVLTAAAASDRLFPMLTTAAGTIRPAKVVVLGAGVAGLQAIATARRLGAVVSGFDVREAAAEQVESLGARFITLGAGEPADASDSGGYAKALADDAQQQIIDGLAPHLADADVVITTAAVPGHDAPKLLDDRTLAMMRRGAVIVDLAASTGGNTTRTESAQTIDVDGVMIIGDSHLARRVAADSSRMYARNVSAFVDLLTDDEGAFAPDWDDDIIDGACIARDGRLVHPRLVDARPSEETT